jgi:hypothetical protein
LAIDAEKREEKREKREERREEGPRKCADLCRFQGMGFVFIRGDP